MTGDRLVAVKGMRKSRRESSPPTSDSPISCGLSIEGFSQIVQMIYDGPFERIPWQSALMHLRTLVAARFVTVILRPFLLDQPNLIITSTLTGIEVITSKHKKHYVIDPFIDLPRDRIVTVGEFFGEGIWEQSDYYRLRVEPFGIRHFMGADIRTNDGAECRLRVARVQGEPPFSESDKALLEMVLPHLKRAVHIHSLLDRVQSERTFYANAVERMLIGTIILDEKGMIMKISAATQKIIDQRDGIGVVAGTLQAHYVQENRELQRIIGKALHASTGDEDSLSTKVLSITRPSGHGKLSILIRAIPLGELSSVAQQPSVAVFIRDPESPLETPSEVVRQLFGFTPTEASLALLLANGLALDEAALKLDMQKNTARSHLRSIFSKTGVTRQTSLVRVLLHSVISLA